MQTSIPEVKPYPLPVLVKTEILPEPAKVCTMPAGGEKELPLMPPQPEGYIKVSRGMLF